MEKVYDIQGMKCAGCVETVTKAFRSVSGVESVQVDLAEHTATVTGTYDEQALLSSLDGTPYKATPKA